MPLVRPFLLTSVQSGAIKGNNTQFTGGRNGQQNRVRPIRPLELLDCKPRCPIKRVPKSAGYKKPRAFKGLCKVLTRSIV